MQLAPRHLLPAKFRRKQQKPRSKSKLDRIFRKKWWCQKWTVCPMTSETQFTWRDRVVNTTVPSTFKQQRSLGEHLHLLLSNHCSSETWQIHIQWRVYKWTSTILPPSESDTGRRTFVFCSGSILTWIARLRCSLHSLTLGRRSGGYQETIDSSALATCTTSISCTKRPTRLQLWCGRCRWWLKWVPSVSTQFRTPTSDQDSRQKWTKSNVSVLNFRASKLVCVYGNVTLFKNVTVACVEHLKSGHWRCFQNFIFSAKTNTQLYVLGTFVNYAYDHITTMQNEQRDETCHMGSFLIVYDRNAPQTVQSLVIYEPHSVKRYARVCSLCRLSKMQCTAMSINCKSWTLYCDHWFPAILKARTYSLPPFASELARLLGVSSLYRIYGGQVRFFAKISIPRTNSHEHIVAAQKCSVVFVNFRLVPVRASLTAWPSWPAV